MGKRSAADNLKHAAAILGKRGGKARSAVLSRERKKEIAAMGGEAKAKKEKHGG